MRSLPKALFSAPLLLLPLACSSTDGAAADDPTGSSSLAATAGSPIVSGVGGRCLDDSTDSTANGNKIQLWECNGSAAQNWAYTNDTFVGPGGKCLDIRSDVQAAGTVVELYQCNGTNAQKWTLSGTSIKSAGGFCLDVKDGVNANGTQIQLASCNTSANQVWHVAATTTTKTPSLRQFALEQTNGGANVSEVNSVKKFTSPTQKGNAIWVVATIPNDGAQKNVSVVDTQGNKFTALDFEQDNSKGRQSVWQFYAENIKGDTSTPDTVTVQWGFDNYKGVLIAEIAGVGTSPLVGHHANIQDYDAPTGTSTVTSGPIDISSGHTPALLLSVSMDTFGGTSDLGGDGYAGPIAGSGFDDHASMWNWDPGLKCIGNVPCNLATFESKAITATGDTAGLFTARAPKGTADPGTYVTVVAAFH